MTNISIDIETFSSFSLPEVGVYKYVEAPDFKILLFGYSVDNGPVSVIDLASGEQIPAEILSALTDNSITKWAFNAAFERICLSKHLGLPQGHYLDPAGWHCTMVWCGVMGFPLSLEQASAALALEVQKMSEGKNLIRFFCQSAKGSEASRNLPDDDPEKWALFKSYNKRDVETEMSIQAKLTRFPVSETIWEEYIHDQLINDRGVLVDIPLVEKAITLGESSKSALLLRMKTLTGLENPNSASQLKEWLSGKGIQTDSVDKKSVASILESATEDVREVLLLRQQSAKSSIKKYAAMKSAACADNRARGMFQFYGTHTGRWAGRLIQLQNLPQNHIENLSEVRSLLADNRIDEFTTQCPNTTDTLSQLIRTAFIPSQGMKFIVADYSAIEARVLAWLANETWRIRAFAEGQDIYCASASQMFGVPVEKNGRNAELRPKGKIAELALGYGGSTGSLINMGALNMGLQEDELLSLVDTWRKTNPNIVSYWWAVDDAVINAVTDKKALKKRGMMFQYQSGMLFIILPSGRRLVYPKPLIVPKSQYRECITYEGINSETRKWERIETYGPKLVENIVQGVARDILAEAITRLGDCRVVMHIHDEVVIEAPQGMRLTDICTVMSQSPEWAPGLLLRADGYECSFYMKG